MDVFVTEPPHGHPVGALAGRFSADQGTFALLIGAAERLRVRETRRSLAIPFFHALGKNLSTVGGYTAQKADFRSQIVHWFAAYDARELVVFDGHILSPAVMRTLFEYAATVPRITFACEVGDSERTELAIRAAGLAPTTLAWDHLMARLPVVPTPEQVPEPAYDLEHLPVTDFLLFRNQSRLLNTAERFDAIDRDYRNAYTEALTVDLDLTSIAAMIARTTRAATTTAPIMVALRATQVALLTRAHYLGVHQDRALGTLCSVRSPNVTEQHWRALAGYVRTHRVAGVALFLLDVPHENINTVTIGDVRTYLHTGYVGTQPVPDLARPLLKAHLHFRETENGTDDDVFLNQRGDRRHLEDIVEARRHLGIPIDPRFLRGGHIPHTQRPIYRFGLELRELACDVFLS